MTWIAELVDFALVRRGDDFAAPIIQYFAGLDAQALANG